MPCRVGGAVGERAAVGVVLLRGADEVRLSGEREGRDEVGRRGPVFGFVRSVGRSEWSEAVEVGRETTETTTVKMSVDEETSTEKTPFLPFRS